MISKTLKISSNALLASYLKKESKNIDILIKSGFKEKIQEGDTFLISYHAGAVTIAKNGKEITSFGNLKFKQALFGIWFGNEPADENLKQGMLGAE